MAIPHEIGRQEHQCSLEMEHNQVNYQVAEARLEGSTAWVVFILAVLRGRLQG